MLKRVRRPYGGQEGKRLRPGDLFWVQHGSKKPPKDVVIVATINLARSRQLEAQKLIEDYDPKAKVEPPSRPAQPSPRRVPAAPASKVEPDSKPRVESKQRVPKVTPPKKSRPGGREDGTDARSSSSPAALPTGSSTLKQRGTRRSGSASAGSPSTTPGGSSPGQTSSTGATPPGGGNTPASGDSAAFD